MKIGDRVRVTEYVSGSIPVGGTGTITRLPNEYSHWYGIQSDDPVAFENELYPPDKEFLLDSNEFELIEETERESAPFEPEYHGHPRFNELMEEFKLLHSNKNYDYARGGDPLGNFKRVSEQIGIPASQFAHHLMMKQVDAVTWSYRQGGEAKVEGPIDKLRDIAVYATLQIILLEEEDAQRGIG